MRSVMRRLMALLLLAATLLALAVGCAKEVYGHGELVIDLPREFEEYDDGDTYDACYSDGTVIVGVLRLSFDACVSEGIPTTMTPRKFAEYYRTLALSGVSAGETRERGDVIWYTYTQMSSGGSVFTYMPTFYFSPYAYFVVTYIVPSGDFKYKEEELLGYAESVVMEPGRVESGK